MFTPTTPSDTPQRPRPSLLTDRYEITMLASFINDGTVNNKAVFEAFARKLPTGRRYGIVAGLGRLTDLIEDFTFDPAEIDWLLTTGIVDATTAEYLRTFRFTGDIDAYPEGEIYFPHSPLLTVSGTLGECVVLETLILSVLNHDSAIASTAARMVHAATVDGHVRPLIEMGSRRTNEQAAVAAARAAYIAGFAATSNLAAGFLYDIPTVGTAAHAFTLAHAGLAKHGDASGEMAAFRSQIDTHGVGTTLLVDTYDIGQGIRHAVAAARQSQPGVNGPGAIRIDSGDLNEEAHKARALLDAIGATDTRITVTSDLDEYVITALADAPIDGYGVGTRLVTAHPVGMVYKLVAIADSPAADAPMRPVAKKASGKGSVGGRKSAYREYTTSGTIAREVYTINNQTLATQGTTRLVQVPVIRRGIVVHRPTLDQIRNHHRAAMATLPAEALSIADGSPVITAEQAPTPKEGFTMPHEVTRALLVVDVQNDFVEGGALAVAGGKKVASDITDYLNAHRDAYTLVIASKDFHDAEGTNHGHFATPGEDPDFVNTWPAHCVAGTDGANYAPGLDTDQVAVHIKKGMGEPAYSMFEGIDDTSRPLSEILYDAGITAVDVVGIATDYCVRATALDARKHSLTTRVLTSLTAGVNEDSTQSALTEMGAAGVQIV